MKAWVLHGINDIRYEETEKPFASENEVLIAIKATGICGSDIPRIYKDGTYSMPLIPGHEFSGQVVEIGKNVDSRWMNKRVGVFPLLPCKDCLPCQKKQYEMCRKYSYFGSRTNGGFAEYLAVPEWNLLELSSNVSYEQAAMLEPMSVAVHALRRGLGQNENISRDLTIVVYGLGTIGILLTMFLCEMGFSHILVIGNKDFQKEMVKRAGIHEAQFCNSRTQNVREWIMQQTTGHGADVIFECVGKNESIEDAVVCTTPGGKVQFIGNPASDILLNRNVYWKILRNQLTVKGSWNSSFIHDENDDWHYVLKKLESSSIHPEQFITQKLTLSELEQGFYLMRDKKEEYVKVMAIANAYEERPQENGV